MKIIHVANYEFRNNGRAYYNIDYKIHQGLVRNNHFVYPFSCNDFARCSSIFKSKKFTSNKVNKQLIDTCDIVKPDLILLGHTDIIKPNTLKIIKQTNVNIKVAMWYVDALFYDSKIDPILKKIKYIDHFFATTDGELIKKFASPDTQVSYIPNMVDNSIEVYKNFEKDDLPIDFLFCGTDSNDIKRRNFLISLKERLSFLDSRFVGCLGNEPLFGDGYMTVLSQTKMGLNYSRRNDVELYSSDRIAQLTGNGILTFTPRIPRFNELYSEDEVVYFDDLDELIEKVMYYHEHSKEAREIAYRGWLRSHSKYNSTKVTKEMLEDILLSMS